MGEVRLTSVDNNFMFLRLERQLLNRRFIAMEILVKPFPSFIKRLKEISGKVYCTHMEVIRGVALIKGCGTLWVWSSHT